MYRPERSQAVPACPFGKGKRERWVVKKVR